MTPPTDAKQRLAALLDAAQKGTIVIYRQKRDVAVPLPAEECDRLRAFNAREFQTFCGQIARQAAQRGMIEEKLQALLADDAAA